VWYFTERMDERDPKSLRRSSQMELPLRVPARPAEASPPRPRTAPPAQPSRAFRVIQGERARRDETLRSRDDVARLLVAAAADMLLRRITPDRAHAIEERVERVMRLFERVDAQPILLPVLRRELDELEAIWREGDHRRRPR
jgi:hypothetical protein